MACTHAWFFIWCTMSYTPEMRWPQHSQGQKEKENNFAAFELKLRARLFWSGWATTTMAKQYWAPNRLVAHSVQFPLPPKTSPRLCDAFVKFVVPNHPNRSPIVIKSNSELRLDLDISPPVRLAGYWKCGGKEGWVQL